MAKTSSLKSFNKINSKKDLLSLQRNFAQIIRRPLSSDDRMNTDLRSVHMIEPSKTLTPHERLELYARQYWWRIEGAFDEDFPGVMKILGEKKYQKLRDEYLFKKPSISFTLRNLGERFPEFIKKNPKLTSPFTKLVYDCAVFEWARILAFSEKEFSPLNPKLVMRPDFPRRKLFLQPHVKLLSLDYPIHEFVKNWQSASSEMASNTVTKSKKKISVKSSFKFRKKTSYMALHRHKFSVLVKPFSKEAFSILLKFKKGASLEQALKGLEKLPTDQELQTWFHEWVTLGWLYTHAK